MIRVATAHACYGAAAARRTSQFAKKLIKEAA
jgi:hypothetical protein